MILNIIIGVIVFLIICGIAFFLHWAIINNEIKEMTEKEKEQYFNNLNRALYENNKKY